MEHIKSKSTEENEFVNFSKRYKRCCRDGAWDHRENTFHSPIQDRSIHIKKKGWKNRECNEEVNQIANDKLSITNVNATNELIQWSIKCQSNGRNLKSNE